MPSNLQSKFKSGARINSPSLFVCKAPLARLSPPMSPSNNHRGFFSSRKTGSCKAKSLHQERNSCQFCVTLDRGSMLEPAVFSGRREDNIWPETELPDKTKVCRRGGNIPAPIAVRRSSPGDAHD